MDYLMSGAGSSLLATCRGADACNCFAGTFCSGVYCSGTFCSSQCGTFCNIACGDLVMCDRLFEPWSG